MAPCCSGQGEILEVSHRLFPTVSINSWNATSLSLYPQDVAGKVRQGAVSTNLGRLCSSAPINCIQETKCNSCEGDFGQGAISRLVKDCKVFYSNDRRGSAGVATLVKTSFLEKHDTEVVKLAPILRGHALAIKFVPKDNSHKPFTVFNIYLSSKDPRTRKRQLKALMLIAPPEYSFWWGTGISSLFLRTVQPPLSKISRPTFFRNGLTSPLTSLFVKSANHSILTTTFAKTLR